MAVLGQYDYTIVHIAADRNCWGDLLSRWVTVPSVSVPATAVYAASAPDENSSVQAGDPGSTGSVTGKPGLARVGGYVVHDERWSSELECRGAFAVPG